MKAHLTVRDTPLREGEAVQTLCELTIYRAKILLLWDQIGMNSPLALSTLLCCRKCCEAYISAPPEARSSRNLLRNLGFVLVLEKTQLTISSLSFAWNY